MISPYKKIKGSNSGGMPMEAPEKPAIDFSEGRNNTPEQKQEISNAQSNAPKPYLPPKQSSEKPGAWQQSASSKIAQKLIGQNMKSAWGSGTGRNSVRQSDAIQRRQQRAMELKRQEALKSKWG